VRGAAVGRRPLLAAAKLLILAVRLVSKLPSSYMLISSLSTANTLLFCLHLKHRLVNTHKMSDGPPQIFTMDVPGFTIHVRQLSSGGQLHLKHSLAGSLEISAHVIDTLKPTGTDSMTTGQTSDHQLPGPNISSQGVKFRLTRNNGDLLVVYRVQDECSAFWFFRDLVRTDPLKMLEGTVEQSEEALSEGNSLPDGSDASNTGVISTPVDPQEEASYSPSSAALISPRTPSIPPDPNHVLQFVATYEAIASAVVSSLKASLDAEDIQDEAPGLSNFLPTPDPSAGDSTEQSPTPNAGEKRKNTEELTGMSGKRLKRGENESNTLEHIYLVCHQADPFETKISGILHIDAGNHAVTVEHGDTLETINVSNPLSKPPQASLTHSSALTIPYHSESLLPSSPCPFTTQQQQHTRAMHIHRHPNGQSIPTAPSPCQQHTRQHQPYLGPIHHP
jgi:hypothetical protein